MCVIRILTVIQYKNLNSNQKRVRLLVCCYYYLNPKTARPRGVKILIRNHSRENRCSTLFPDTDQCNYFMYRRAAPWVGWGLWRFHGQAETVKIASPILFRLEKTSHCCTNPRSPITPTSTLPTHYLPQTQRA